MSLRHVICFDEERAHRDYLWRRINNVGKSVQPTFLGGIILIGERESLPKGFIEMPNKGTPVDVIKFKYTKLYNKLREMGVRQF